MATGILGRLRASFFTSSDSGSKSNVLPAGKRRSRRVVTLLDERSEALFLLACSQQRCREPGRNAAPVSSTLGQELLALAHDRHVVPPLVYDYPGDAVSRVLDSMTMEDYLVRTYGVSRDTVRLMKTHDDASAFGLGPDALVTICFPAATQA
jgi:hypothetical protein